MGNRECCDESPDPQRPEQQPAGQQVCRLHDDHRRREQPDETDRQRQGTVNHEGVASTIATAQLVRPTAHQGIGYSVPDQAQRDDHPCYRPGQAQHLGVKKENENGVRRFLDGKDAATDPVGHPCPYFKHQGESSQTYCYALKHMPCRGIVPSTSTGLYPAGKPGKLHYAVNRNQPTETGLCSAT